MDIPFFSIVAAAGFYYLGYITETASSSDINHANFLSSLPTLTVEQVSQEFKRHPTAFTNLAPLPVQAHVVGYTAQRPEELKYNTKGKVQGCSKLIELEVFDSVYPNPVPPGKQTPYGHYSYKIHRDYLEIGSLWSSNDIKIIDRKDIHNFHPTEHKYSSPRSRNGIWRDGQTVKVTFPEHYITVGGRQLPNEMFELEDFTEKLPDALDIDLVMHSDNPVIEIGVPVSAGVREEEIAVPLAVQVTMMGEFYQDGDDANCIKIRRLTDPKTGIIYPFVVTPIPKDEVLEEMTFESRRARFLSKICYGTSATFGTYAAAKIATSLAYSTASYFIGGGKSADGKGNV